MSDPSTTNYTVTVAVALISSGGLWTILQTLLTRRERKDKQRREMREDEQAEKDRSDLLAEAQRTAQQTALESADKRYNNLEKDYDSCRRGLGEVRDAAACLIDVMDGLMMKLEPNGQNWHITMETAEVASVRSSINEARRHLLYFTDWKAPFKDEGKK
jgi:hypothetical protein